MVCIYMYMYVVHMWTGVWCAVRMTCVAGQVGEVCGRTGVWCAVRMTCVAGQVGEVCGGTGVCTIQ